MTASTSSYEARARRCTGIAALAGGLIGLILAMALSGWSQRTVTDIWQRTAPRTISADSVAVVLIDNASIETVGPWPWPRYYMARLAEQIGQGGAKVIAFDMLFPSPDAFSPEIFASLYPELPASTLASVRSLPDMDEAFARAIGSAPVLLPRLAVEQDGIDPDIVMMDPEIAGRPPPDLSRAPQVMTSIPGLDDVALAHAVINGPPDSDGTVRRVPLAVMAGDRVMPGLAVELARIASGVERLEWRDGSLAMGSSNLPADKRGSLALRMGFFPEDAMFRADEVLAGNVAPDTFRSKVVLIGMSADGTSDIVATPLANAQFGVFVQAQAVDAILSGGWLSRPAWVVAGEFALSALLVALVLVAAMVRKTWPVVLAACVAVLQPLVSFQLFDRANLVSDPSQPALALLGALLAMWATLYVLARAERTRLAAALVEQRVAVAEQEGELRAARRIQLGMVPSAERLAALPPEADIGAVLRPAKSVGGDFYDATLIAPGKLLFAIGDVTGKGVPAALYMALSKALSKSVLARGGPDLGAAMAQLNRELMNEADDEMGVTMLVGLLDCASGAVSLVNAGHENPLVVRSEGAVESLSMRGGPPFCVIDFPYPEEPARLEPGDTIVLITDGATEAQDADFRLFGLEGIIAALEAQGTMSARKRVEELANEVRAFEGDTEPSDDLTILALCYRGAMPSE